MSTPFTLPASAAPTRRLYGKAGPDILVGTAANELLDGQSGVDTMEGKAGDDWYVVDSKTGETIIERAGEGIDTVISWASLYTLAPNVENLEQRGDYASKAIGNELDNLMIGSAVRNTLLGEAGRDILVGGGGADELWGGSGSDIFRIDALSEAGDRIHDFTTGEDILDLRGIAMGPGSRLDFRSVPSGIVVSLDGVDLATLVGVTPASLPRIGTDVLVQGSPVVTVDGRMPAAERSAAAAISADRPPLAGDTWALSWGADRGLAPQHLFWSRVPDYADAHHMAMTRDVAAAHEAAGRIAVIGMQGWEDMFRKSLPGGSYSGLGGHQAWVDWVRSRPHYLGVDSSGKVHTATPDNPHGWGYVSPLMRLDAADVPAGFSGGTATYADWMADRLGRLAAETGTRGFNLADFYDGHPHSGVMNYFNARILADFSAKTGIAVPAGFLAQQAEFIRTKHPTEYLDFFVDGWSYGWKALAEAIERHTGQEAWLTTQFSFTPAAMREYAAVDVRVLGETMDLGNILLNVQTLERFVMQHKPASASYEAAMIGIHAARAPDGHFGHMLSASEEPYWNAVSTMYRHVDGAAREELGWGRLEQTWLQSGWTHVAENDGGVRRAAEVWQRSYHDLGSVDAKWLDLLRDVVPTRPFGPALYYSVNAERAMNALEPTGNDVGNAYLGELLEPITRLQDAGVPFGYYVSDSALAAIGPENAPSAWIIPQRYHQGQDLFSASEIAALRAKAPVLVGEEALAHHHPLSFRDSDPDAQITGFGFYDQSGRLIVVASDRVDFDDTAARRAVGVTVEIDLADDRYAARNLVTGETTQFDVTGGSGSFDVTIGRWDTLALAITPA